MNKPISLEQIEFSNKDFWKFYFCLNYPNAYDEDSDLSIGEIIEDMEPINIEWINEFTQFYNGVFEETDGNLENTTILEANLSPKKILKIEFHPGDTLFFIDGKEIGCTGSHWKLQTIPYASLEKLLQQTNGDLLFFLLLPMALFLDKEVESAKQKIESLLPSIFPNELCKNLTQCIICGLI